jgi:hypothetical protein
MNRRPVPNHIVHLRTLNHLRRIQIAVFRAELLRIYYPESREMRRAALVLNRMASPRQNQAFYAGLPNDEMRRAYLVFHSFLYPGRRAPRRNDGRLLSNY